MISRIDFTQPLDPGAPRLRHAFGTPHEVLAAQALHEVRGVLDAVHAAAQQGRWCVGCVRYEAAAAFDAALLTQAADGPLAWFAVYDAPLPWPACDDGQGAEPPAQVTWTDSPDRAALKVSFFGPFYGGYNVVALDENYQWAMVVGSSKDYLWILSRTPTLPWHVREHLIERARTMGLDVTKILWMPPASDQLARRGVMT